MAKVIAIDGCMGVGKSTVAQLLAADLGCPYFAEQWEQNHFIPLLSGPAQFDPEVVTSCQQLSLSLALENLEKAVQSPTEYAVLDVSPMYVAAVYSKVAYDDKLLNLADFYRILVAGMAAAEQISYHYVLVADPLEILRRIARRGRQFEATVEPLVYRYSYQINDSFINICDQVGMVEANSPAFIVAERLYLKVKQ